MSKTIFYNGQIITLDSTYSQAEALLTDKGKILAIGSSKDFLNQFGQKDVKKVDLNGGFAYPGLIDSHMHLSFLGQKLTQINLSACKTKKEMLILIRQRAETASKEEWILGWGWDDNQMEGPLPTLAELDEVSLGNPLLLTRICHHVYLANSRAAQLARQSKQDWNGLLYENEAELFLAVQPVPSYKEKKEVMRNAAKQALAYGLTAVHTEDMRYLQNIDEMIRIHQELQAEGIYLRTHQLIDYAYVSQLPEDVVDNEWFQIGAMKIFADGVLGGRTAWLSQPYSDQPNNVGVAIHKIEKLHKLAVQAADRDMPIAVHAIGDEAIDQVLQIMAAHPNGHSKGTPLRHRLIHALVLRPDLIERMCHMNLAIDIQPHFVVSDFPWVIERLGKERMKHAYSWKTLLEHGIKCAGGSDAPIEPLNPLKSLHAAMTRSNLTALEALHLYTIGSAYAEGQEYRRGTISIGKQADLTVFDRDLLAIEADELLEAKVKFTIVNGKIAYQN